MPGRHRNDADHYVAKRLRLFREHCGLSQKELASALGVTFQQVQKYESGANRITAGRLHAIARLLNIGVENFFDGLNSHGKPAPIPVMTPTEFMATAEALQLVFAFMRVKNRERRRRLVDLMRALAEQEE